MTSADKASNNGSKEGGGGVKVVPIPHPDWQPGEPQPPPFKSDERLTLDPDKEEINTLYPFFISAVLPRPIAFISTVSTKGVGNLSPYSFFNVMSSDPPTLTIGSASTSDRPSRMKDSLQNILETKEFTLNMISEWFLEAMNHTCGEYDAEVDEIRLAGLTKQPSVKVKPPRIAESSVQMECRLKATHEVYNKHGKNTGTIIIGEVVLVHVLKDVTTTSPHSHATIVDLNKYQPVSRLGGNMYAHLTEAFDLPRPTKEAQYRLYPETRPSQEGV